MYTLLEGKWFENKMILFEYIDNYKANFYKNGEKIKEMCYGVKFRSEYE